MLTLAVAIALLAAGQANAVPPAGSDAANDWLLPGHDYGNNRYVTSTIDETNIAHLRLAWKTQIADDGEQEAAPIISNGVMFLSTPHNHVIALDATSGALKWDSPYTPSYILDFAANRGVGLSDGKIFIATQDCKVRALDAATGKALWSVTGCSGADNNWYSMPAYVLGQQLIVGVAGGDFGGNGSVQAFSTVDGHKLWQWNTIPAPGEPGHETWSGDAWKHGGAALWGGLSIDPDTQTLYIAPGNAGPDFSNAGRPGKNLYSDSVVALDISGSAPKMKWYYQIDDNDTHDSDPAMPPVLFDGTVAGQPRKLLVIADKSANFLVLDRTTGEVIYKLPVAAQQGLSMHPTTTGEVACPNHGGGVEWLGGAYDPKTNLFIIPATQECGVFHAYAVQPAWKQGTNYRGGPPVARADGTGIVSAIDIGTGKVAWTYAAPYPAEGGALITSTGLTFTTDLSGTIYALDTKTGAVEWRYATGSSIVAPFSTYKVGGKEYLALEGGEPGNQKTPNLPASKGSYVFAFSLDASAPMINGADGQSAATLAVSTATQSGTAPYTQAQVTAGKRQYATSCAICHGAQLQGISAPALAGSAFGKSHL
ncbi:MAG TPA: PQQ-binding-like beta-propeller repeat protein, partial [Candidatus Baltobacteraceae bacterium]